MRYWRIGCLFFLTFSLFSCAGSPRDEGASKASEPVDLNVPAPTTYCEKTWSCSYENLVQDEARRAMVQKRKAFVTACEDALRRMPAELVKKYENCTRVSCGDELRSCLLQQVPERAPGAVKPE